MTMQLSPTAAAYIWSVNDRDPAAFDALFADGAVVNDGQNVQEYRVAHPSGRQDGY